MSTLDEKLTKILENEGCDCLDGRNKVVKLLKSLIKETALEVIETDYYETEKDGESGFNAGRMLLRFQQKQRLTKLLQEK